MQIGQKKIEELMEGSKGIAGFQCYKFGVGILCKAADIGLETFLLCLEKKPEGCNFSVSFGNAFFCKCPLRILIARETKE